MRRFLLTLGLVLSIAVPPAYASRVWETGFEEGVFTNLSTAPGSSVTVVTTAPHSGTYHMRAPAGASNTQGFRRDYHSTSLASGQLTFSFYWTPSTLPTSGTSTEIFSVRSNGGAVEVVVKEERATGKLQLVNQVAPETVSTTMTVSAGTMYRLVVRYLISDTVGQMELIVHAGDQVASLDDISVTQGDTLASTVQQFFVGPSTSVADGHVWYYDDVIINYCPSASLPACSGFQEGDPGPTKLAIVVPTSDDTVTWTRNGASCTGVSNAKCVNEMPPGPLDETTYNETTSAQGDKLAPTGLPAEVPSDATIKSVDVWGRFGGASNTGTNTGRMNLWDQTNALTNGPATQASSACDVANTFIVMRTDEHLVFDPGARTKANLDAFRYGYEATALNAAGSCRMAAVWVYVEWTPAAGGTTPTRSLLGVGN